MNGTHFKNRMQTTTEPEGACTLMVVHTDTTTTTTILAPTVSLIISSSLFLFSLFSSQHPFAYKFSAEKPQETKAAAAISSGLQS